MTFRIYRDEDARVQSPSNDSHPRLIPRFSSRSLLAGAVIYPGLFGTRGFSERSFPASLSSRRRDTRTRSIDGRSRDYSGGRTRILIFALAMFRVRPGVNWMLIAVDSWSYIRGTLSPSPPEGPAGPRPQVVYPHVTPLCSATTTTVPPSDHHSPLGQTPHSPSPTNTRVAKKHSSPSSTNDFRSLSPSPSARDA